MLMVVIAAIILAVSNTVATAQRQSLFDRGLPSEEDVTRSLAAAKKISAKKQLMAADMLQIYRAEKQIGKYLLGIPLPTDDATLSRSLRGSGLSRDARLMLQCIRYVQSHSERFREVHDGWKGENNFWEPNRYWIEHAKKHFPHSKEAMELEFDLDFKEFIRRFDLDEFATGKTCAEYFEEELKQNLDTYLEVYSKEEIARWPGECDKIRKAFVRGRNRLLEKYRHAPFTKVLQDIDPTTIVIYHSVC